MKVVSIVIPCYDEEKNIELLYKEFFNDKYKYELIFVNDGSKDNTESELNKLLDDKKFLIKIINFSRNFGKEAAMYAGLCNSFGDYVAIIDSDLQQNPKLILNMLDIIEQNPNYDSVVCYQEKRKENILVSFLKKSFYKVINKTSEIDFVTGASDFRLLSRKAVDAIISMKEKNRFSKGIFSWIGFNQYYMSYKVEKRKYGNTKWSLNKLFNYAFNGIRAFSDLPIRIINILSNVSIISSIIYLVIALFNNINMLNIILFFILFMSGIIIKSIYISSKYIYHIYDEVKNRPIYIVKDIKTNKKEKQI